ncbi:MAG: hypothetical protein WEB56_01970 [Roseovarius sp.]
MWSAVASGLLANYATHFARNMGPSICLIDGNMQGALSRSACNYRRSFFKWYPACRKTRKARPREINCKYLLENSMMNWNEMSHAMGFGMGISWLFCLLILALLVLAIAALIKYLRE